MGQKNVLCLDEHTLALLVIVALESWWRGAKVGGEGLKEGRSGCDTKHQAGRERRQNSSRSLGTSRALGVCTCPFQGKTHLWIATCQKKSLNIARRHQNAQR